MNHSTRIVVVLAAIALLGFMVDVASAANWYVRTDGSDANVGTGNTAALAFKTIQKAVDSAAASGDTIYVAAGVYVEVVTIRDKSLDLRGGIAMPGIVAGETRLQIPLARSLDPTKKTGAGRQADPLVWVEDTTPATASVSVDLHDLTLDGVSRYMAVGDIRFLGVMFKNCTGTAVRLVVENFQQNPVAGGQCAGIMVDGATTYAGIINVTVYACTIQNVQKAGIVAFEGSTQVRSCRVLGYGPTSAIAQVGIQFGPSGTGGAPSGGSMHGNEVSGFEYTGASYAASGILLYGPTGVIDATGNFVTGCDVGIYVGGTVSAIGPHQLYGNTVNDYEFEAIYTKSAGSGSYFGNRFLGVRPLSGPAFDDGPATGLKNLWLSNLYHDVTTPTARAIPGTAGNSDGIARAASAPFGSSSSKATLSNDPVGAAVADFNGDTKLDVAIANNGNDKIEVHYGDGANGFAATETITLPVGSKPVAVATGNLNAAAGIDIAVACENGTVVSLLNSGGPAAYDRFPTSGSAVSITGTVIGVLQKPSAIAVGNVDGANNDDILLSLAGNSTLIVPGGALLLTNAGAGTAFVGSNPFGALISSSYGCCLSDLDGDSDLDAVIADAGLSVPKLVSNVRTFSNSGGTFSAGPVLTAGLSPRGLTCGDLNGDGLNDIVVANFGNPTLTVKGTVSVLENTTTTTLEFNPAVNTTAGMGTVGVAIGDMYGDNSWMTHKDVVAVNFTDSTATALIDWREFSPKGGAFGAIQTLTGLSAPLGAVLADFDKNFSDDLAITNAGSDDVTFFPGLVGATLEYYGHGCAGYLGKIPVMGVDGGLPTQPRTNFALTLSNARPNSIAVIVGSYYRANPIPPECGLLFLTFDIVLFIPTDAAGRARLGLGLPATPDISGYAFYWQWGVFDVDGKFFGMSLSNAVKTKAGK